MRSSIGHALIFAGVFLVVAGILVYAGWLSWFGRLPGDIRVERQNLRVYVPLTSMLIVSIVLSLAGAALRRFLRP